MGPVTTTNKHKQTRIFYTFCLPNLLAIIYGVYSVIRYQKSMAKSRELCESERAAIYHLRIAGHSFAEIAKQVGCTKSTAYRIMQKHEKTGSLLRSKKSGRPKVISRRGERIVTRIFKTSRFAKFNEIKDEIDKSFPSENLSKSTIMRVVSKHGIKSRIRKQKPYISKINRTYRMKWAKTMMEWPLSYWDDVIFSDECRFSLVNDSGVRRVWRTACEADNPEFFVPAFTGGVSVMVWGCIGPIGVGNLVLCEKSVNSEYYIQILKENLPESVRKIYGNENQPFIFQQDNAPCHKAVQTCSFLKSNGILQLPWPSQSPDLNIIENVWQYMKNMIRKDPPKNKHQLVKKIFEIWAELPRELIVNLYSSIPRRLNAVRASCGYPTKY